MTEHKVGDLVRPIDYNNDSVWEVVGANGKRCVAVSQHVEPDEETPRKAWGNNDRFISLKPKGDS